MSILAQIPPEAVFAALLVLANAPLFLELVKQLFAIFGEMRAAQRQRKADERARSEATKTSAGGASSAPSCVVVTTGMHQNIQVNFLTVNQQFIIRPFRDDEQELAP